MSDSIIDGGPAFPTESEHQSGPHTFHYSGMTLRDWFAGQALAHIPALLEAKEQNKSGFNIARHAYEIADAMIVQRAKEVV